MITVPLIQGMLHTTVICFHGLVRTNKLSELFLIKKIATFHLLAVMAKGQISLCNGLSSVVRLSVRKINFFSRTNCQILMKLYM